MVNSGPDAFNRLSRREWLQLSAATIVALPSIGISAPKKGTNTVTPEQFGAVGDGMTNDTAAFAAMTAFVNEQGGGDIALRPRTYLVGTQAPDPSGLFAFAPGEIMHFKGCTKPLNIYGSGARLRCADGLRFGTFDPSTGQPTDHPLPYLNPSERASPYEAMIFVEGCSGGVFISGIELDGNLAGLILGGPYGDTGWQIPAFGLRLVDNQCTERINSVYTHHHALDGVLIDGVADRTARSVLQNITSEYNARQGCSITGGRYYSFVNCRFNHTGKAGFMSAPGAGVDIEAETKPVRSLGFSGCEFSDNAGPGMIADTGDSEAAAFDNCRFIGTSSWSAWPNKPFFRFANCEFVGALVHAFGDADPERAGQFSNCLFQDDPALSPTGQVYEPNYAVADLYTSSNVLFDGCRFQLTSGLVLPWTLYVTFNNCTMSQVSTKQAYPRGKFTGVNRIDGNVDLYGSTILGDVTLNGQLLARTSQPSAQRQITKSAPGLRRAERPPSWHTDRQRVRSSNPTMQRR